MNKNKSEKEINYILNIIETNFVFYNLNEEEQYIFYKDIT